jgi:hypothetical protein
MKKYKHRYDAYREETRINRLNNILETDTNDTFLY